ncbi:MAG: DUF1592 domain-containing protein [Bacteroidetes bacterium]|nr:DUF1592 domain-containing protein [Bacteroidota bacterium]MDA1122372.1 DUF1592 domain-containing protein [Bacteroidota bacterium]
MRSAILSILLCAIYTLAVSQETLYEDELLPILSNKCFECHRNGNSKGGISLKNYEVQGRVIKDGQLWSKVADVIESGAMPPKTEPQLTQQEFTTLVDGLNGILESSLKELKPGQVVIRRLSHAEYGNTVFDLTGVSFDTRFFPSDGSGGSGFDNQGGTLFITPLKFERYFEAADKIIETAYASDDLWRRIAPFSYDPIWIQKFFYWLRSLVSSDYNPNQEAEVAAEKILLPFASNVYRRFPKDDEKAALLSLFNQIYNDKDTIANPDRFDESIALIFKSILVSPSFLYKVEEEPQLEGVYPLSNFELASRLSYFLWNSMPDQELFDLAYMGKLQDTLVLEAQVHRMLADPKSKRFAETFSTQWLGITKLLGNEPIADMEIFPEFNNEIREALYSETVEYFYHVLTNNNNMMELINSNYAFLNEDLAAYYGIEGVSGQEFQKVLLKDSIRGGVLGMGSVLTTSSQPHRTSPVLRGKWVLEQLLGTSPPPPPEMVAELTEDKEAHDKLGLRNILEIHRSNPACFSCHQKMDPLGLGLENYDAIGRWRTSYGKVEIDASGVLEDGRPFNGPKELKLLIMSEKEKIARNFSTIMLSYALGRGVLFTDEPVLRKLETCLLESNFNPELFLTELIKSYVFRMKLNDFRTRLNDIV